MFFFLKFKGDGANRKTHPGADLHGQAAGIIRKPDEKLGFSGVEYAIENKYLVADSVEGPTLGFELLALLGFDAGGNGLLTVANGKLNGLAWIQLQASEFVESADDIGHAGRDVGFGCLEGGVFQQIPFEIRGFPAYRIVGHGGLVMAVLFERIEIRTDRTKLVFHLDGVIVFELIQLGDQAAGFQMQFGLPILFASRQFRFQAELGAAGIDQAPFDVVGNGFLRRKRRGRRAGRFGLRERGWGTRQEDRTRAGKAGDEACWHELRVCQMAGGVCNGCLGLRVGDLGLAERRRTRYSVGEEYYYMRKLHILVLSLLLSGTAFAQRGGGHGGGGGRGFGGGGGHAVSGGGRGFSGGGFAGRGFAGGGRGFYGGRGFGYGGYGYGRFGFGLGFGLGYWPGYYYNPYGYGYPSYYGNPYYPNTYGYSYAPSYGYSSDGYDYDDPPPAQYGQNQTPSYRQNQSSANGGDGKWHHFGEKPGP